MHSNEYDITLWESFLTGDQQAFGLLFKNNYPHLIQYGNKICRSPALLEDTIQELFLDIWKNRNPVPALSVRAYLLKALKYKLLKELSRNNHTTYDENDGSDSAFELGYEAMLIIKQEDEERTKRIQQSLQELSHRQREIIYLKFYQNLSYEEVSEIMNINYQAARNLLYHAIKALKSGYRSR
ncbi:MAG TPA: sigma-70 family RNA polymerase sigma factor [Chitinophagaceae bacterium]